MQARLGAMSAQAGFSFAGREQVRGGNFEGTKEMRPARVELMRRLNSGKGAMRCRTIKKRSERG